MTNKVTQMSCSDNHVAFCYKGKRIVVRFKDGEKITMDVHKDIGNEEPNQAEWKNGDECVYNGRPNLKCMFVAIHPGNKQCAIIWEGGGEINLSCVSIDCLSKPETPEQKAERERLEAIDSMFTELNLDEERELNEDDRESIYWKPCEVAYDAGYRKQ